MLCKLQLVFWKFRFHIASRVHFDEGAGPITVTLRPAAGGCNMHPWMDVLPGLIVLCGSVGLFSAATCVKNNDQIICDTLDYDGESGIQAIVFVLSNVKDLQRTSFTNPKLKSVKSLTLGGNQIRSIEPQSFHGFPGLTSLLISNNDLRTVEPSWFYDSALLETLNVTSSKIQVLEPRMLAGFSALKVLNFKNNSITEIRSGSFRNLSRLSHLDLSSNNISYLHRSALGSLRNATFRLDGNPWNCSCALREFSYFLQELQNSSRLDEAKKVMCRSPSALRGTPVQDVNFVNCSVSGTEETPADTFHQIILPALLVLLGGLLFCMTMCTIVCFLAKGWKNKVANVSVPRKVTDRNLGKSSSEKNQIGLPTNSTVIQCNPTDAAAKQLPPDLECQPHYTESVLYKTAQDYYYKAPRRGRLTEIVESDPEASIRNHTVLLDDDRFLGSIFGEVTCGGGLRMPKCSSSPGFFSFNETFNGLKDCAVHKNQNLLDLGVPVSLRNTTDFQSNGSDLGYGELAPPHSPPALDMQTGSDFTAVKHEDEAEQDDDAYSCKTGFEKYIETCVEPSGLAPITEDASKSQTCPVQGSVTLTRRCKTWNSFSNAPKNPIEEDMVIYQDGGEDKDAFGGNLTCSSKNKYPERELFEGRQETESNDFHRGLGNDRRHKSLASQIQPVRSPCPRPGNSSTKIETDNQQGARAEDETINVDINASTSWCWPGNDLAGKPTDDVCEATLSQNKTFSSLCGPKNDDHLPEIQSDAGKYRCPVPKSDKPRRKKQTFPLLRDETAKERFWKLNTNCCDESKPCPTAESFLSEGPNVGRAESPPSDRDLLEDRISLPYLPSVQSENSPLQSATLRPNNFRSLPNLNIFKNSDDGHIGGGETQSSHTSEHNLNILVGHPGCNENGASSSTSPGKPDRGIADKDHRGAGTGSLASMSSTETMKNTVEIKYGEKNEVLSKIRSNNSNCQRLSRVAFSDSHLHTTSHVMRPAPEAAYTQCSTEATDQKNDKTLAEGPYAERNVVSEGQTGKCSSEIVPTDTSSTENQIEKRDEAGEQRREFPGSCALSGSLLEPDHCDRVLQEGDQDIGEETRFIHGEFESILEDQSANHEGGVKSLLRVEPMDCIAITKSINSGCNPSNGEATRRLRSPNISANMEGLVERDVTTGCEESDRVLGDGCNNNTESLDDREIASRDGEANKAVTKHPSTAQEVVIKKSGSKKRQHHSEPVVKILHRDLEHSKTKKSGNKVSPLGLLDEEHDVKRSESLSAKQGRRAYRSLFSMSMNVPKLEGHTEEGECNVPSLEVKNPILHLKRFKVTPCSVGRNTNNESKYNETIDTKRRDTIEHVNYLYARKPEPFYDLFGGLDESGHKTDDLSVLSNLHFCKVSGRVRLGTETDDTTTVDLQGGDANPVTVSLRPDRGYLPPMKEELRADGELAILNIMSTLKRSLQLSVDVDTQ